MQIGIEPSEQGFMDRRIAEALTWTSSLDLLCDCERGVDIGREECLDLGIRSLVLVLEFLYSVRKWLPA
jgi:hypothetical protein